METENDDSALRVLVVIGDGSESSSGNTGRKHVQVRVTPDADTGESRSSEHISFAGTRIYSVRSVAFANITRPATAVTSFYASFRQSHDERQSV